MLVFTSWLLVLIMISLLFFYKNIKKKLEEVVIVDIVSFGDSDNSKVFKIDKKQADVIVKQMIKHKSNSFVACVVAFGISFLSGILFVYFIAFKEINGILLVDAIALAGGLGTGTRFYKLYKECKKDIDLLIGIG